MEQIRNKHKIKDLIENTPLLGKVMDLEPVLWFNKHLSSIDSLKSVSCGKEDIDQANRLWKRFAPYLELAFPELKKQNGSIESPLIKIEKMASTLNKQFHTEIKNLFLKCDHALPVAGSIKARGGIYEVLHLAESLAIKHGLITTEENYEKFIDRKFKKLFSQYTIGVGSTGNLGLSIGIIGTKLGFNVSVYMSADAKQWKKDLLREKGAQVYEYSGDFGEAITKGRQLTNDNPNGYFIDDEDSKHLFLGYSTAAFHLKKQLHQNNITVDENNPLFLYLPCGVGGAPGGITFGVKHLLGDNVHCFFVEPTHSPSLLIGLLTGEKENICVQHLGIDNITEADGLAVGRPSTFATDFNQHLVSGIYTIEDQQLFTLLTLLKDSEGIFVEPSATPGLMGPMKILQSSYLEENNIHPNNVTHIVWSTGGAFIPESERKQLYKKGKSFI